MDFKAVNSFLLGHICEKRTTVKKAKMKSLKVCVRLPIGRHDVRTYILDHNTYSWWAESTTTTTTVCYIILGFVLLP